MTPRVRARGQLDQHLDLTSAVTFATVHGGDRQPNHSKEAAQMGRTIIETETAGWYEDPATGKKTRKQDGDTIMTMEQYRRNVRDVNDEAAVTANGAAVSTPAETTERMRGQARAAQADKPEPKKVKLTSGKTVTGEVVTVKCSHIEGKDHDKKWSELSPAERRKACGKERTIKVQDAFQAKRCIEHQKAHRNALKRAKTAERRAEREAAKAKA